MIRKKLLELEGGEILAREIMTADYQVVLPEGAKIRKDYINRLSELGIAEVFIREQKTEKSEIALLKSDIDTSVKEKVRDILERHTYRNNDELIELGKAADNIIATILEEDKVIEKVFDIKARGADIYEHSINVCALAILAALKLNMEIDKIHDIGVGCLLHDIGLRYTIVDFNDRDIDTLSQNQLAEYKKHPVNGYYSLKNEAWISDLSKAIVLQHHERLDGKGFPLKAADISFECQIVNVCDTFDEMICGIACRRVKVYEAIEYLKSYKNILFNEKIVDAFLSFTAVYPAGTQVLTNEGELAVVLSQNKNFQDRPVIRILKDKNGNDVRDEIVKDLVKVHNIFIEKAVN